MSNIVVVAKNESQVFHRVSEQLLDQRHVRVVLDRRRGERRNRSRPHAFERRKQERRQPRGYWEDLKHHPLVVVPAAAQPAAAAASPEPTDRAAEVMGQINRWMERGHELLSHHLSAFVQDHSALQQENQHLREQLGSVRAEVAALQVDVEHLKRLLADTLKETDVHLQELREIAARALDRVKPQ